MFTFYSVCTCMMKKEHFLNVSSEVPVQKSQTEAVSDQDLQVSVH